MESDKEEEPFSKLLMALDIGDSDKAMDFILDPSTDINSNDKNGRTPLMIAASKGFLKFIQFLMQDDRILINKQDINGQTALMLAVLYSQSECVQCLLGASQIDLNIRDKDGMSAILLAAKTGHTESVKKLIAIEMVDVNAPDSKGKTPLMLAAQSGHRECVQSLLDTGQVFVNVQDSRGQTALLLAVDSECSKCVQSLLDTGQADVNHQDFQGNTALMAASEYGEINVVKSLLATGEIDVNLQDKYGNTAILLASIYGRVECLQSLLATGKVEVDLEDGEGNTALMAASESGTIECLQSLVATGQVEINHQDRHGNTAIMLSVTNRHIKCYPCLLATGQVNNIDINVIDSSGKTVIMQAAEQGDLLCLQSLLDIRVIKEVCDNDEACGLDKDVKGQNLFIANERGNSVFYMPDIHWRQPFVHCKNGEDQGKSMLELVVGFRLLPCLYCFLIGGINVPAKAQYCSHDLLGKSKPCICDDDGNTALMLAAREKQYECLEYLLQYERIRFHALVHLLKCYFINANKISLVLYKMMKSLIWDSKQIDYFLTMMCNGVHIGKCVDFLLSAFICQTNYEGESALSYSLGTKCIELLTHHLSYNDELEGWDHPKFTLHYAMRFRNNLNYISILLENGIFFWSWDSQYHLGDLKFLARELVIHGYTPQQFKWKGNKYSPIQRAFFTGDVGIVRYLVANIYFTLHDFNSLQRDTDLHNYVFQKGSEDLKQMHRLMFENPWCLEAISLLKISSLLKDKRRENDMVKLKSILPRAFDLKLQFKNSFRYICVDHWPLIPVDFLFHRQNSARFDERNMIVSKCCNGYCKRFML